MDTRSKKFNFYTLVKAVAVLLVVVTAALMGRSLTGTVTKLVQADELEEYYEDALLVPYVKGKVYSSRVLTDRVNTFIREMGDVASLYGSGTKADYESYLKRQSSEFDRYKQSVLVSAVNNGSDRYWDLLWHIGNGIIELELIGELDYEASHYEADTIYSMDEIASDSDYGGQWWYGGGWDTYSDEPPVILLENLYYYEGASMGCFHGFYQVHVNDEGLLKALDAEGVTADNNISYKQFLRGRTAAIEDIEKRYSGLHYVFTSSTGGVVTNIEDYREGYDFTELRGDSSWVINGTYDGYGFTDFTGAEPTQKAEVITTAALDREPTTMEATVRHSTESVTVYRQVYYGDDEYTLGDYMIFLDGHSVLWGDSVNSMINSYEKAGIRLRDMALTVVQFGAIFLLLFAVLVIFSGRRYRGDELRLFALDRMFTDLRFVIDGGLIFGAVWLSILFANEMYYSLRESGLNEVFLPLWVAFVFALVSLLFTDLVTFFARKTKAGRFWCDISYVWLIRHFAASVKGLKRKKIYVKNVSKSVKIKTALLAAANILLLFLGILYMGEGEPDMGILLLLPAAALDIYVLYRGIRFVGGTQKLFDAIESYRKGDFEEKIDTSALPEYLMLPAENLMSLSEGMKSAVDEAVKQEQTKTELITNISHDLKTPLTSIINYTDLLMQCDISDETAKSYLEILAEKSDRLKRLITDLVEASKAATGNVSVETVSVSLTEMMSQLIGEHSDELEAKGLEVILTLPREDITVRADSKLLYRVAENLIVNIKVHAMGGTRVYISAERRGNSGVMIFKNISAAALNISAEELKQRFVRGDESRTGEGNGLGLSIAESLCNVQGGRLDIEISGDLFTARVEMLIE